MHFQSRDPLEILTQTVQTEEEIKQQSAIRNASSSDEHKQEPGRWMERHGGMKLKKGTQELSSLAPHRVLSNLSIIIMSSLN